MTERPLQALDNPFSRFAIPERRDRPILPLPDHQSRES